MRAVMMLRSLGDYARLMVFPGNLHMERTVVEPENYLGHDQWRHSAGIEYLSILGLLFLRSASLRRFSRRSRVAACAFSARAGFCSAICPFRT